MVTFNFDDGTANSSIFSQTTTTLALTEDGINFTFSTTNADPLFNTLIYQEANDRILLSNGSVLSNTVFTLDATGPGAMQTQFFGNATTPWQFGSVPLTAQTR